MNGLDPASETGVLLPLPSAVICSPADGRWPRDAFPVDAPLALGCRAEVGRGGGLGLAEESTRLEEDAVIEVSLHREGRGRPKERRGAGVAIGSKSLVFISCGPIGSLAGARSLARISHRALSDLSPE